MVNYSFSLSNFEYFLLILVRVASFVYIAPIFGNNAVNNRVKVGFSAFVSLFLYNLLDYPSLEYSSVIGYAVIVAKEATTGFLIGFSANICTTIVLFAGNIIDMDIGLSMATEFNPSTNNETTISGNMYYYFVMLILIVSNMHQYIIKAVCQSFQLVPVGGTVFNVEHLLSSMTRYMGDAFVIGFRIFLPFFACIMILNCILGIMAKVSPQMNMFSIGMQLKVFVGFTIMILTIFLLPKIAEFIFDEIRFMVGSVIDGMH